MTQTVDISVIIPAYNCESFLADALNSVLAQNHPRLEILVVDDGSTDRSLEVARSFPGVRCFSQPNAGPAAARNAGLREARGAIYAFLDGDDAWSPDHLEALLPRLEGENAFDISCGRVQRVGPRLRRPDGAPDFISEATSTFVFGSCLIRAEAFHRVGWINQDYRRGEDTEWGMRAREKGLRIYLTDQVILYYRRHGSNITKDASPIASITLQVVKESLDRRRSEAVQAPLTPVVMAPALKKNPD